MVRIASVFSRQIVSIFIIIYCVGFWQSARQLEYGPAVLYPQLVIGVLLAFVAAEFVAGGWRAAHETDPEHQAEASDESGSPQTAGERVKALWAEQHLTIVTTVLTGLYIFVMPTLGFYIATGVYLAILLPYLGVRRPVPLIAMWAGSLLVAWGVFAVMLSVRLPQGLLG